MKFFLTLAQNQLPITGVFTMLTFLKEILLSSLHALWRSNGD